MAEDYKSIMKNEVWDVVLRLKGKYMVTSKFLFKIKHVIDGRIKKYKARFGPEDSPRKRKNIMMIYFHLWLDIKPFVRQMYIRWM